MDKDQTIKENQLPHSVEAEQAVIGGLMLSNGSFDVVAELIVESDFFSEDHKLIFETMRLLSSEKKPLDVITLSETLQNANKLENVGGASYLVELSDNTPSSANVKAYAQIVLERSIIRKLIIAATDIVKKSHNPHGWDSSKLLADAEKKLAEIIESRPKFGGFQGVNELIKEATARLDELFNNDSEITGLSTGFDDLDKMTSGWQKSDLVIIAGRPSMGKTAFAMNMVEHAILKQDKPVLVFSMEMPANQLMIRLMSSIGKIDATRMRTGKLLSDEWPRLNKAAGSLRDRPLYIDDTPGISPMDLRNRIRQLYREQGDIGMIMIDYLQLMNGSVQTDNRTNEITQISRELKGIAREFNCPVLALSQLSRKCEERPNKRPINSDLRESGAIEQDADVVAFIYRDEVYNEETTEHKGIAEIIIGKQRNGPIGNCKLAFLGTYTRFENLAPDYSAPNYSSD